MLFFRLVKILSSHVSEAIDNKLPNSKHEMKRLNAQKVKKKDRGNPKMPLIISGHNSEHKREATVQ